MNSRRTALQVLMNGRLVGWLRNSSRGVLSFQYDRSWVEFENRRSISLLMPLAGQQYSGLIVENYFDNLLPDINECCDCLEGVIEQVGGNLPQGFPEGIVSSIFAGLQWARDRLGMV